MLHSRPASGDLHLLSASGGLALLRHVNTTSLIALIAVITGQLSSLSQLPALRLHAHRRVALHVHKAALHSQRALWRMLLHNHISFSAVVKGFKHIEATRSHADKVYRALLERYPRNVKVGCTIHCTAHCINVHAGVPPPPSPPPPMIKSIYINIYLLLSGGARICSLCRRCAS